MDSAAVIAVGDVVTGLRGTYRVEARHAEGAFGVAYRAIEEPSGRRALLKELRVERLGEWKALELFEREAKALAGLSHPNIPAFCDFFVRGADGPHPARDLVDAASGDSASIVLVQQFVEGETLQDRVDQKKPLSPAEADMVLRALLRALDYLHGWAPPIVHRDIKPANVVLTPEGRPCLVDFGAIQDPVRSRSGSTIVGTVGYMPIEQLRGDAHPASDLYALGVALVVALTGRPLAEIPFEPATGRIALPPGLPAPLRDALAAMTAPLLGQRAKSATDVLARLDRGDRRVRPLATHALAALAGAALSSVVTFELVRVPAPREVLELAPVTTAVTPPVPQYIPENPMWTPRARAQWIAPAPDSVEGMLLAQGSRWVRVAGDVKAGDYVEDILVGRLNQPPDRGSLGRVLSNDESARGGPVAQVSFGRDYVRGIFTRELSKIHVTPDAPFDRGAAATALTELASNLGSCWKAAGPTGDGHIQITFTPAGDVATAVVDQAPFAGTAVGGCIAGKFRGARVPPFAGGNITVGKRFTLGPRP